VNHQDPSVARGFFSKLLVDFVVSSSRVTSSKGCCLNLSMRLLVGDGNLSVMEAADHCALVYVIEIEPNILHVNTVSPSM
jgi:hypothetical protein